jgi:hypothetical protein
MTKDNKTYDIFISHSISDKAVAEEVATACRAGGLEAFTVAELLPGANWGDEIWEAQAESQALIIILTPSGPTSWMWMEIGAGQAWNKPIFAILAAPASTHLPAGLSRVRAFTPDNIGDIINLVRMVGQEFSESDRSRLANIYLAMNVSTDPLSLDPNQLAKLASQFRRKTGKDLSEERLLSELVRMRKDGSLTREPVAKKPRARAK